MMGPFAKQGTVFLHSVTGALTEGAQGKPLK